MDEQVLASQEFGAHEPPEPTIEAGKGGGAADEGEDVSDLVTQLGGEFGNEGEEDSGTEKPAGKGTDDGNRAHNELLASYGLGPDSSDGGADDEFKALLDGAKGDTRVRIESLIGRLKSEKAQSAGYLRLIEAVGAGGGKEKPAGDDGKDDAFKPIPIEAILKGMDLGEGEEADAMRADITKLSPVIQAIAAAQNAELMERFNGLQLFAQEGNNQVTQAKIKAAMGDRWNPTMNKQVKQLWASMGSPPALDTAQGIIMMAHSVEGLTGASENRGKGKGRLDAVTRARRTTIGAGAGNKPGGESFAKGSILSMSDNAFKKLDASMGDDDGI